MYAKITGKDINPKFEKGSDYGSAQHLNDFQRKKYEEMRSFHEVCDDAIATVQAENREDITLPLADLKISDEGVLVRRDYEDIPTAGDAITGLPMGEVAWQHHTQMAPKSVPARLRGNVHGWLHNKRSSAVFRTHQAPKDKGMRSAFSTVSTKYQAHDLDQMATLMKEVISDNYKGSLRYCNDGGRYEVSAILARPFDVDGDIHRVTVTARSADNGTASQSVFFKAWRQKCSNGIYVQDSTLVSRTRHMGDGVKLREQFAQGLEMASQAIESFSTHWKNAQHAQFVDKNSGAPLDAKECLKRLAANRLVHVPHVRPRAMFELLEGAWNKEPGQSVADVINAATRLAHENADNWKSEWYQDDVEQQAGSLLYQSVYTLRGLTPKQEAAFE